MAKLGVLQHLWDAWMPEHNNILRAPADLFPPAYLAQLKEIKEHLRDGDEDKALNEIVDMISLSVNWLRWFGLKPQDIAELIDKRIQTRYVGQVSAIMKKYGWPQKEGL